MKRFNAIKIILVLFFIITVILPLANMLTVVSYDDFVKVAQQPSFTAALYNSVFYTSCATAISVLMAFIIAWCLTRTNVCNTELWTVVFTVPMLIPSISHGLGLIILLGANGVITRWFDLSWSIYGPIGVVLGSVLYSLPIALLMLVDVLKYEDGSVYEAAEILGLNKWQQLKVITWPYLRKPLIAITFAVFTLIITDYGVPLIIGGRTITLPVLMYQEVIGLLDFGKGVVISTVLLLPAIVAFTIDIINRDKGKQTFITKLLNIAPNKTRDVMAYGVLVITALLLLLPIITFGVVAFVQKYPVDITYTLNNFADTFKAGGSEYIFNSILIAFVVAGFGVVISFITAYMTARILDKTSKILHLAAMLTLAIPGVVLGLSYLLFFKGSILQGSIALLIMVNCVHFFASPYLMIYNTLRKINANLEIVGLTLGVGRWPIIKDVILPMSKGTLVEMFSYYFVNCMITISAVSFLANMDNKPIALMIPQFEGQVLLEYSAVVSLIILITNLAMKGIAYTMKRDKERNKQNDTSMVISKKEFDILVEIECSEQELSQRELANATDISLGTINKVVKQLEEAGLVKDRKITKNGLKALSPYKVKRAVFLAAGFGSRLVPVSLNTPKPLVRVKGQRIIDSLLDAVVEAGIEEVIIVRGYLAEQLDQLKYKYPQVKFIDNPIYNESNNISSALCARYMMSGAYVLEADLLLYNKKLISKYQYSSNYLAVPVEKTDDWCFFTEGKIIKKLGVGGVNCHHMYGISYWSEQDGNRLAHHIEQVFNSPGGKERYWDQVALGAYIKEYNISVRECSFDDIVEIDTFRELKELDPTYGK